MALLSLLTDPLDYFRPSGLLDRHLAVDIDDDGDDFFTPTTTYPRRHRRLLMTTPYNRNWRRTRPSKSSHDKGSIIDQDKFKVSLDVQQFHPEEITVKVIDRENMITVEGKHEEREDEHGLISRHFIRKYKLPEGHVIDKVQTQLSSDGVLTITAPKKQDKTVEEREVRIILTGKPSTENVAIAKEDTAESVTNGVCTDEEKKDRLSTDTKETKRRRK